jgi:hypothetical protein
MNSCTNCFYVETDYQVDPCNSCSNTIGYTSRWVSVDFLKDIPGTVEEDEAFGVIANMTAQLMVEKAPEASTQALDDEFWNTQRQLFSSALNKQVEGKHYKDLKIQPIEFLHANNIPFAEGCAIKYLCRWRDKGGIKDLEKAKHFIELLIELEGKQK